MCFGRFDSTSFHRGALHTMLRKFILQQTALVTIPPSRTVLYAFARFGRRLHFSSRAGSLNHADYTNLHISAQKEVPVYFPTAGSGSSPFFLWARTGVGRIKKTQILPVPERRPLRHLKFLSVPTFRT